MKDAHSAAKLVSLDGKTSEDIVMPGIGTAAWSSARLQDKEMFYGFDGFTIAPSIYRLDLETGKSAVIRQSKVAVDLSQYETKQVFYASKDGTRVPMFLSSKKGLKLDGQNPTLLYAYGGFDVADTPGFRPRIVEWMQMGGVYASADIRGGSEYGEAWHQAGMRAKKQNVFDDFIAAAEWLIANKYTSTPKLAIYGASNGGLLIGAVLNQRPDLFGAIVCQAPLLDMKRYHKLLAGASWMEEYGDHEKPDDWAALAKFSPYQNLHAGTKYPRTLFTSSTRDDRVHPGHARKMVARMLEQGDDVLYYENIEGGHGGAADLQQEAYVAAIEYSFLAKQLGLP